MKNGIATFEQIEALELRELNRTVEDRTARERAERAERALCRERDARKRAERRHEAELRDVTVSSGLISCAICMGLFAAAGLWLGVALGALAGGGLLIWNKCRG